MGKISDFFAWALATSVLIWALAMIFASSDCQRVHRSAIPIEYSFTVVQYLSKNWTTVDTQISILEWKVAAVLDARSLFEKTIYGEGKACKQQ